MECVLLLPFSTLNASMISLSSLVMWPKLVHLIVAFVISKHTNWSNTKKK